MYKLTKSLNNNSVMTGVCY